MTPVDLASTGRAPSVGRVRSGDGGIWVTAIALSLLAFVWIGIFALLERSAAMLAATIACSSVGLMIARRCGGRDVAIFLIVNAVATIGAIVLYYYYVAHYGVPYWQGGSDELHFEEVGAAFAESASVFDYGYLTHELVRSGHNSVGYLYLVGLLTKFGRVFGEEHTMVPRLFNAACLALVAVGVHRLAIRLEFRRTAAVTIALAVGCLPLMVWTSAQVLREIPLTVLLMAVVLLWTPHRGGMPQSMMWRLTLTAIVVALISQLRMAQAFVAVLVVVVGFVAAGRIRLRARWVGWCVVLTAGAVWGVMTQFEAISARITEYTKEAIYYATYRVEVTGGGLSAVVFETPPPLGYLLRIAYALASPIPIPGPNADELVRDSGTIIHILFVPYLLLGLGVARRRNPWMPLVAAFLLLFIGMALFTFTIRHIVQYLPFAALIAALGFEHHRRGRVWIFTFVVGTLVVLALTYVSLKA